MIPYEFLADLTVALHAAFILFVVAGEGLILAGWAIGWQWTRCRIFRAAHLAAIVFVAVSTWFGLTCPLTTLENNLRRLAGTEAYDMSFIGYWLNRLIFHTAPEWAFTLVYSVFGLIVLFTYIAYPPRRISRHKPL